MLTRILIPALMLGSALSQPAPVPSVASQQPGARICMLQATPDGQTDVTAALQRALDDCAAPVGTTVGGEVRLAA